MKNQIYFIGGASASGKSTIAKGLSDLYALPVVELDRFYDILMQVICDREELVVATKKVALEAVKQFLGMKAGCIIEGGWIQPEQANIEPLIENYTFFINRSTRLLVRWARA